MARKSSVTYWWVVAVLIFGAIVLVGAAFAMGASSPSEPVPTPTRAAPSAPSTTAEEGGLATPTPSPTPEEPAPLVVPESPILQIAIPALALDVAVSGETFPRETENCHGAVLCIDPPVPDQAAWYGATPATPSAGTVRLFGHTSWTDPAYAAFNDILAMQEGDEIIVTTEAGVFTYRARAPQLVPYSQVAQSQLIWGDNDDRLVLITCNSAEASGTIVEAWLVEATERL